MKKYATDKKWCELNELLAAAQHLTYKERMILSAEMTARESEIDAGDHETHLRIIAKAAIHSKTNADICNLD